MHPGVNTEGDDSIEVPLDFDWNMSQDVEIQLKSNVRTRAYIYEDENLKNLMCTTVLEADKPETVSLTTSTFTVEIPVNKFLPIVKLVNEGRFSSTNPNE